MLNVQNLLQKHKGLSDPLEVVAGEISDDTVLLCLDEFMVMDVADALILNRLFRHLFSKDIILVSTSNRAPDNLYEGGLQRDLFLPFIATLKERCVAPICGKDFVFYKYYGSHVEKTEWVIHQYHATNVPRNKRNLVLCRVMKKIEVGSDALMYDEGESSHVGAAGADLENIATTDFTPNVCGSPEVNMEYNLLASPHEDDYSFPEYSFHAATNQTPYFETENSNVGFPFETDQEDNADYISFFN